MKRITSMLIIAATVLVAGAASAQSINGEVRKIDAAAGKITLKHGPIPSLEMDEPMTMVFQIKDAAALKQLKVGDKVKFDADRVDGKITVTKIQKAR
ncbi:MAG: copper-binding protein [Rhizobiales bacterium]|nr:copper-binding protein [Hyphomicrobiales bacterium]OJY43750.1 MAG: RND transporter [Rhizobiales bacterium 64-17]